MSKKTNEHFKLLARPSYSFLTITLAFAAGLSIWLPRLAMEQETIMADPNIVFTLRVFHYVLFFSVMVSMWLDGKYDE